MARRIVSRWKNPRTRWTVIFVLMLMASRHSAERVSAVAESVPSAFACDVERRSVDEIVGLLAARPGNGTPWPTRLILPLPNGTPADPATAAEIALAVRTVESCVNAGDLIGFMALFSDRWLGQIPFSEGLEVELNIAATTRPSPLPDGQRAVFHGPWRIERLEDGRVLAAVVWFGSEDEPNPDPSRTRVLIFARYDGHWLIDEIIEDVAAPECAVPVAVAAVVGPPPGALLTAPPVFCS